MAKKKKAAKKNRAAEIVKYLLVALLLLACLAILFQCTKKQTTFSVVYNGKEIVSDAEIKLPIETALRFDVKCAAETQDYDVTIVANVKSDTDFEFTVDGSIFKFSDEPKYTPDFKDYFDFSKQNNSFTLTLHKDTTMQSILSAVYALNDVIVPDTVDLTEKCYFAIVVTSDDAQIRIPFRLAALSIVLDHSSIIF